MVIRGWPTLHVSVLSLQSKWFLKESRDRPLPYAQDCGTLTPKSIASGGPSAAGRPRERPFHANNKGGPNDPEAQSYSFILVFL